VYLWEERRQSFRTGPSWIPPKTAAKLLNGWRKRAQDAEKELEVLKGKWKRLERKKTDGKKRKYNLRRRIKK
jgi:hypothetical protein